MVEKTVGNGYSVDFDPERNKFEISVDKDSSIPNSLNEVLNKVMDKHKYAILKAYSELLIQNIILQLKLLPPHKNNPFMQRVGNERFVKDRVLREEIIKTISIDKFGYGDNSVTIKISHPLAYGLNYGTGMKIDPGKGMPHRITPVKKQFMFIPGASLGKAFMVRQRLSKLPYGSRSREKSRIVKEVTQQIYGRPGYPRYNITQSLKTQVGAYRVIKKAGGMFGRKN